MKISQNGIYVIHYFESCKLQSYPDPGSLDGNPWTIGWGHTGPEVIPGLVWTQEQADKAFLNDLNKFEQGVNSLVTVPLTQGQFDALVSFSYNVGLDIDSDNVAEGLGDSTLLRKINLLDYKGASMEFHKWNKNNGKVMLGLTRRRVAEEALFNGMNGEQAIKQAQNIM
ncbi:lysozyme [Enterobacter roggenkampii]|uniref:lysozyme n=1 Tax=Enterobacter roggenkampii TaxID=1812935 RepID=UPI00084BEFFA|nr:lysozyme [Enterobacter roggenkampii]AOP98032.1 glycoside hydrolase [Enterobacter roggenkampii]QWZ75368.1 lysozyme [Enterobacter roggenkampii]